jgi:hypothetical protein
MEQGRWNAAREGIETLRSLFMATKNMDIESRIKRFIVTGITRLTHTSMFSGANNFTDMTSDPLMSRIIGFTEDEIRTVYADELEAMARNMNRTVEDVVELLKRWYNGYCFDGLTTCFNPFPVLRDLQNGKVTKQGMTGATGTKWLRLGLNHGIDELLTKQKPHPVPIQDCATLDIDHIEKMQFNVPALLLQIGLLTLVPVEKQTNSISISNSHSSTNDDDDYLNEDEDDDDNINDGKSANPLVLCRPPNKYACSTIRALIQDSIMFSPRALAPANVNFMKAFRTCNHHLFSQTIYSLVLSTPYQLLSYPKSKTMENKQYVVSQLQNKNEHEKIDFLNEITGEFYIHRQIFTVLYIMYHYQDAVITSESSMQDGRADFVIKFVNRNKPLTWIIELGVVKGAATNDKLNTAVNAKLKQAKTYAEAVLGDVLCCAMVFNTNNPASSLSLSSSSLSSSSKKSKIREKANGQVETKVNGKEMMSSSSSSLSSSSTESPLESDLFAIFNKDTSKYANLVKWSRREGDSGGGGGGVVWIDEDDNNIRN